MSRLWEGSHDQWWNLNLLEQTLKKNSRNLIFSKFYFAQWQQLTPVTIVQKGHRHGCRGWNCVVDMPRKTEWQALTSNVEAGTPEQYWMRTIFIPFVDCICSQLDTRFQARNVSAVKAVKLLPNHIDALTTDDVQNILIHFIHSNDLRSLSLESYSYGNHWSIEHTKPINVGICLRWWQMIGLKSCSPMWWQLYISLWPSHQQVQQKKDKFYSPVCEECVP